MKGELNKLVYIRFTYPPDRRDVVLVRRKSEMGRMTALVHFLNDLPFQFHDDVVLFI